MPQLADRDVILARSEIPTAIDSSFASSMQLPPIAIRNQPTIAAS
jgi:hypothetical protein